MDDISRALRGRERRTFLVAVTAILFITIAIVLGVLVNRSIETLTMTANRIDDERAMASAVGAVHAIQKSLASTMRDNAYWDEAVRQLASNQAQSWALENWASVTSDYPLYDTVIVLDSAGRDLIAYHKGIALLSGKHLFDATIGQLIEKARNLKSSADDIPTGFIRSADRIFLIAAAPIVGSDPALFKPETASILVLAKHMDNRAIAEISAAFNLDDLTLGSVARADRLVLPLADIAGRNIGYINWPSQQPGTASYASASGMLRKAAVLFAVFLVALSAAGAHSIRELRRSEARARQTATHDSLTGLLNRAGLTQAIAELNRSSRIDRQPFCLHLIDLDGFKAVNDAWGHPVGDQLLEAVATRLLAGLPAEMRVCRLGGDEFAVLGPLSAQPGALGSSEAADRGHRIRAQFREAFEIGDRSLGVGASVGFAVSDGRGIQPLELIRQADIALYKAKALKDGSVIGFDTIFDLETRGHALMRERLRAALDRDEVYAAYHPLIEASGGRIIGVEALARWRDADGSNISPETFIPVAEKNGLIDALGLSILRQSLTAAAAWPDLEISVNVSPLQLRNPHFPEHVLTLLREMAFPARRLTIEVTEGIFITDPCRAGRSIETLRAAGVRISLDDFGSGFASIGRLRDFRFDRMKLDRSLIAALDTDDSALGVLTATVALAGALSIPVTAEGIETDWHAQCATAAGCETLQGYLYGKPVPAEAISARLARPAPHAAHT